jgi:hypothetical protein
VELRPTLSTSSSYEEILSEAPPPKVEINRVIQIVSLPARPKRVRLSVSSFNEEIAPTRPTGVQPGKSQVKPERSALSKALGPALSKKISPLGEIIIREINALLLRTQNVEFCPYFVEEGILGPLWEEGLVVPAGAGASRGLGAKG